MRLTIVLEWDDDAPYIPSIAEIEKVTAGKASSYIGGDFIEEQSKALDASDKELRDLRKKCTVEEYSKLLEIARDNTEEARHEYFQNYCRGSGTLERHESELRVYTNDLKFINELRER